MVSHFSAVLGCTGAIGEFVDRTEYLIPVILGRAIDICSDHEIYRKFSKVLQIIEVIVWIRYRPWTHRILAARCHPPHNEQYRLPGRIYSENSNSVIRYL